MEIMTKQQQTLAMRVLCVLAGVLVVGWIAGTFCDLQVDQAIYAPDNTLVIVWSALGLIPLALPLCLFLGVLLQRCWEGAQGLLRFAGSALSIVLALVTGVLGMRSILKADGIVHLKTDSNFLYTYTDAMVKVNELPVEVNTTDLYGGGEADEILSIRTYYEQQWLDRGLNIKYLKFHLPQGKSLVEPEIEIELDDYRSYNRSKRSGLQKSK
jgi:hypothetical protein